MLLAALLFLLMTSQQASVRLTHTPTAIEILERVRNETIPAEDSPTGYGPAFNQAGYNELITWNRKNRVAPAWAADFEALDVTLPCCGFTTPSAVESKNCACGHHQALYGAGKRLLIAGHSRAEAQIAIRRWAAYFYPKETLIAEIERRALTDRAISQALQELKEKGQC